MQGYTGPINCGANQQSLQNSINALNQAQQNYIQGQTYNAQRRENDLLTNCRFALSKRGKREPWHPDAMHSILL
jgi:hypothetical protein